MKRWRQLSLKIRLSACFLAILFVFSVYHLFAYNHLLKIATQEAYSNAGERMSSAAARLDENLSSIQNDYLSLKRSSSFQRIMSSKAPSAYDLVDLYRESVPYFGNNSFINAYTVFLPNTHELVTSNGNYQDTDYFSDIYYSDEYSLDFWLSEKNSLSSQNVYPVAAFSRNSPFAAGENEALLPVLFKNYWKDQAMVLLLLDIRALCESVDSYLEEGFYIFRDAGDLIYSSEDAPAVTQLTAAGDALYNLPDGSYAVQRHSSYGELTYMKHLSGSIVVGQINRSIYLNLMIAILVLLLSLVIAVLAVGQLTHSIKDIMHLLPEPFLSAGKGDELQYIRSHVENMLSQNSQQARKLAEKDAALSGFLLQSQLKDIYVDMDTPKQSEAAMDRAFAILYFRIHYRQNAFSDIRKNPSVISHMMAELIQHILRKNFESALLFQLESNQFIAKISFPNTWPDIDRQMGELLRQLDNENEYAFFTLVQSPILAEGSDFADFYRQVLDAAQYVFVKDQTQLLRLPLDLADPGSFSFPAEQEKCLQALIYDGRAEEAAALTSQMIQSNLGAGIRRIQMILLCSTIMGSALRVLSRFDLTKSSPALNGSSMMNALEKCETALDYQELITDFVRNAALCISSASGAEDSVVKGVQVYLQSNYQREFSMDEMADALHLSKNYLSAYYKEKTGTNLSDSIQFFRIQKAIELLEDPRLKIGDIGAMVGINNSSTFLRQFKKYTSMTPKEYRVKKASGE